MGKYYDDGDEYVLSSPGTPKTAVQEETVTKSGSTKPNGGLRAWLQVAGAFFLYLNTWGNVHDAHNFFHFSPLLHASCSILFRVQR